MLAVVSSHLGVFLPAGRRQDFVGIVLADGFHIPFSELAR